MGKPIVRCNFVITDQVKIKVWNDEYHLDFNVFQEKNHPELLQDLISKNIRKSLEQFGKQYKKANK